MTDTRGASADDNKKLIPELDRSEDEQILWFALAIVGLLALMMFGLSRCDSASGIADNFTLGSSDDESSISLLLDDDNDLDTSASFFEMTDFDSDLADGSRGPFTILAPTDSAWDAAAEREGFDDGGDLLDELSDDDATEGAGYHVIQGKYTLGQLQDAGTITTVGGYELTFTDDDLINGAIEIDEANIEADNGLMHKISGILPTSSISAEPDPTATPEATEVAPTPEPDPTAAPEPTATPEPAPEPTTAPEPTAVPEPEPAFTIASLASESPDLSRLTGLVGALGLDATLADPDAGPFTVFAPTDSAFDDAMDVLASLNDGDVESTVGYHVVPGLVEAADVVPGARFETLSGETLVISSDGSLPGSINVLTADLETDNGIVHVIDGVLVPTPVILRNLTAAIADLEGIQFDVGSANIRPESEAILVQAASVLKTLPDGTLVEVAGHTDSDGGADGNQALSEARANSVLAYLVGEGVDADVLTAVGYGETDLLVDPEVTDADKQANRRIEFVRPS